MKSTLLIARRELRAFFRTPLVWLILAGSTFVMAWVFLWYVQRFLELQPRLPAAGPGVSALVASPILFWAGIVLVLITPLLAMRLIAGDRVRGSFALLRAAPISSTAIVLGKYLALEWVLGLVIVVVVAMPLTLQLGTSLDFDRLMAATVGLLLLAAAFGAISLCLSAFARQPVTAAFGSFAVLLILWLFNLASKTAAGDSALTYLSPGHHLIPLLAGEVSSADITYFLIVTALFLGLAVWKLDIDRLGA